MVTTPESGTPGPNVEHAARELSRVHRALKTLSAANRALLRATDEQQLLGEMCRVAVESGGYRLAWAGYAQNDERKTIRPMAQAGAEAGFLDEVFVSWDESETGRGAGGTAVRSGKACVIRNILTDPSFAAWREAARKRGFASVIGLPLFAGAETLGVLLIYAPEPDAFDEREVELLGDMAQDLSFGIEALRTRTRQREAEETIRRMAYYDALTGLPNRQKLKEVLQQTIGAAKRENRPFPLLLFDVDRFREINEGLGYAQGDQLLRQLAARLQQALLAGETLAYLGVDEFAIVIPRGDADHAAQRSRGLLKALEDPFLLTAFRVDVRARIGIALFPGHGSEPDALILHADSAMQECKRGANDYAVYKGGPGKEHARRLELIADLTRAIEDNQLMLYCQPKVHISSGTLCGAEALVRWKHPQHGMISLYELIPLAEQTGQIKPLTWWMMDAALRQCHAWCEDGMEVPLAVNVSVLNLREPGFLDRISGLLATWGTHEGLFQLELTESALMEDPAGALEVLNRLRGMGIELFVDDFGTGYSSLSYLQKLPVNSIKIDQSFVRAMATSEESANIVRSTIDLAHNLKRKVVAEGVESREIWECLAALGCDIAQGYYIAKPMPAGEFRAWQASSPWKIG